MLVVHAHLHRRRTGVTTHTESVARAQSSTATVRILGGHVDPAIPRIGFGELLAAARREPAVFHAHRNLELLVALLLRLVLRFRGARLALVATRHGGGRPSWITRLLLRRADRVIALTGVAQALLPVPSVIVGHGVDLTRFHPPASGTRSLEALGPVPRVDANASAREHEVALAPAGPGSISSTDAATGTRAAVAAPSHPDAAKGLVDGVPPRHAIGVIGRIRPAKGQGDFARAIAPLLDAHPDWVPVVMGLAKGPEVAFAKNLVAQTGGRLRLLHERPDPAPIYRALTVLVQPSHAESYSLVLLEAMASGCCVIAARLPHYDAFLEEGVTGLTYPVGDQAALRAQLERVMKDPALAIRLGHAAAAHARAHFGIAREAEALLAVYQSALHRD